MSVTIITESTRPIWRAGGQAGQQTAGELLKTAQYKPIAELLRQAQLAGQPLDNPLLADMLTVAHRICLAGSQCQADAAWHRRAYLEASERERELKQQLQAMLDLISKSGVSLAWDQSMSLAISPTVGGNLPEDDLPEILLPAASLVIYCLGPFRVYQNGQLITVWSSLKGQAILKYLLTHPGTPIAKDILMELFWPEADPEAARRNLHQAIYSLRQTLKQGQADFQPILFEHDCYRLNPELNIWLDWAEFVAYIQAGRRWEAAGQWADAAAAYSQAESLYRGDFLEEDLYEDWASLQRDSLQHMYLDLADRLSESYLQQGEYAMAIALCQKILARDNCHERAHGRLMQSYYSQGQRCLALQQYQRCVQALRTELGVQPSAEMQTLYARIAGEGGVLSFNPPGAALLARQSQVVG